MNVTGIKWNGERIPFERWLFESYTQGRVTDPLLLEQLNNCTEFHALEYYGMRSWPNTWRSWPAKVPR